MTGVLPSSRIFFGQHDVQQHQVGLKRAEILHALAAVLGHFSFKALLFQVEMEQLGNISIVLYDQYLLGHKNPSVP